MDLFKPAGSKIYSSYYLQCMEKRDRIERGQMQKFVESASELREVKQQLDLANSHSAQLTKISTLEA